MPLHQIHNSKSDHFDLRSYESIRWQPHFHGNFELTVCLEGTAGVTVDGKRTLLKRGEAAWVLPNAVHAYDSPAPNRVWIGVFSDDYLGDFPRRIKGKRGQTPVFVPSGQFLSILRRYLLSDPHPDRLILQGAACLAAGEYLSQTALVPAPADDSLQQILAYLAAHFREDLTMDRLARALGYEYHYLSRKFRKALGMNFRDYLTSLRLEEACRLLRQPGSVTEAALAAGFQSIRAFHDAFRLAYGTTPRAYRKSE